jgi:hypothetical protein
MVATEDDSTITFAATASVFDTLVAQADAAVALQVAVTTTDGIMYFDGDYDDASDSPDQVQFADSLTVTAKTKMTLEATTGSIVPAGKLTLVAGSGLTVVDHMTSAGSAKALVMDVDSDNNSDGTLTVFSTKTVTTGSGDLTITAFDMDMSGSVAAGTATITVHGAVGSQTMGIGDVDTNMEILDGELGNLAAPGGLTVGSASSGELKVRGVTDANSDAVATITLIATQATTNVVFLTTASKFNKGIVVQAAGGVILSESLTTQLSETVISANTGSLTIVATKTLTTSNQLLTVTADDVTLSGDSVESGTAAMILTPLTSGSTIGVGITGNDLNIEAAELAEVDTAGGLTIGSLGVSGSITVTNIANGQ